MFPSWTRLSCRPPADILGFPSLHVPAASSFHGYRPIPVLATWWHSLLPVLCRWFLCACVLSLAICPYLQLSRPAACSQASSSCRCSLHSRSPITCRCTPRSSSPLQAPRLYIAARPAAHSQASATRRCPPRSSQLHLGSAARLCSLHCVCLLLRSFCSLPSMFCELPVPRSLPSAVSSAQLPAPYSLGGILCCPSFAAYHLSVLPAACPPFLS